MRRRRIRLQRVGVCVDVSVYIYVCGLCVELVNKYLTKPVFRLKGEHVSGNDSARRERIHVKRASPSTGRHNNRQCRKTERLNLRVKEHLQKREGSEQKEHKIKRKGRGDGHTFREDPSPGASG